MGKSWITRDCFSRDLELFRKRQTQFTEYVPIRFQSKIVLSFIYSLGCAKTNEDVENFSNY